MASFSPSSSAQLGSAMVAELERVKHQSERVTRRWMNRAYRFRAQRDTWKHRYEEERRLRLAAERALVTLGREAA